MNETNSETAETGTADQTRAADEGIAGRVAETHRKVRCRRCRGPLYFPTGYSAQHRAPVMFCRKCGAQTRLPMKHRWVFVVLAIVVFIAAWIFVIRTFLIEDALAP